MQLSKVKAKSILPKSVEILGIKNMYEKDYTGWKELRKMGVGGSDIGALLGVNNYKKAIDVYLDKVGEGEEFEGNHKTEYGIWQEPVIADRFEKNHGGKYEVYELGYTLKNGYLMANVDRVIYDKENDRWGILEIKTAGEKQETFWSIGAEIKDENTDSYIFNIDSSPDSYYAQTQLYLEVTKFDFAILCGTIGQKYFESDPFKRNDQEGDLMRDVATSFFTENVKLKEIPSCDGTDSFTKFLKEKYPSEYGFDEPLGLNEDEEAILKKYFELQDHVKELKGEAKVYEKKMELEKQRLLLVMGDSNFAKSESGTIKKSSYERLYLNEVEMKKDFEEVKKEYPKIFESGLLKEDYKTKKTLVEKITISKTKKKKGEKKNEK